MLIRMKNISSKDIANQVNWLHYEVINSFMFRLTKDISNTIYRALSKGLLIAYRSPLVCLNDPVNATNKLYRDLAMVHTVVRSFFHKLKKSNDLLKLMIIHFNVIHDVVEYAIKAEGVAKAQLIQLYIDFPSSRFFKITFGVNVIMQLSRFIDPP